MPFLIEEKHKIIIYINQSTSIITVIIIFNKHIFKVLVHRIVVLVCVSIFLSSQNVMGEITDMA